MKISPIALYLISVLLQQPTAACVLSCTLIERRGKILKARGIISYIYEIFCEPDIGKCKKRNPHFIFILSSF